jgi:FKBP-type peptidyl-prolyl cis-trans isomerase
MISYECSSMNIMNRNKWIAVGAGIVVTAILLFGGNFANLFISTREAVPQLGSEENNMTQPDTQSSELVIEDVVVGTGAEAEAGAVLTVHYVGALTNGQVFDSSVARGQPFEFRLGAGDVIRGWDEGFAGMKVGGKRRLVLPPEYAYGNQQAGPIPPNSTLLFEVELLAVTK